MAYARIFASRIVDAWLMYPAYSRPRWLAHISLAEKGVNDSLPGKSRLRS